MRTLLILLCMMLTIPAFAAKQSDLYLSPLVGYHFFDEDHDLDDKIEGGLRLGYFVLEDVSIEAEADYTNTDHDSKGGTNVTSISAQAVKFFDIHESIKPYIFLGVGGMFHENDMASLVAGVGGRFIANEMISVDLRIKDMLHSIDGRNDIIPSVAINFHLGASEKPMVKSEPAPKPMKKEPAKMVAKKAEPKAAEPAEATVEKNQKAEMAVIVDTDGDGVPDTADKCSTPSGYPVDATGCTPDTDNDGVYDFQDKCPNTLEGTKVNSEGCFVSATLSIQFASNSAVIPAEYNNKVEKFAQFMKDNPAISIEIQGHTDDKGSAAYNKSLSQKRADAVVQMLVKNYGVESSRLVAKGYGEEQPIVPNDTKENMLKNRRIDTVIKK